MVFFRHLTEWIFIFLDSEALNFRKLSKNPLSNFSEAGLAKLIFTSEAGQRPASLKLEKVIFFQKMLSKTFSFKIIDLNLFLTFFSSLRASVANMVHVYTS